MSYLVADRFCAARSLRQGAVYPGEGSANPTGDVVDPLIGVPPVELAALLAR